jgi:hypothetical protein
MYHVRGMVSRRMKNKVGFAMLIYDPPNRLNSNITT